MFGKLNSTNSGRIKTIKMKGEGYSIKDLEVLSGIKAHTIRIWEKRYNLLKPHRTDTNIRFYNDDDLRRMLNISMLVKNGFKISKVSKFEESAIKEAVLSLAEKKTSESDYVDRLILYMLNFDNLNFNRLINEILHKFDFDEAFFKVFFKLFDTIGTYWQVGSVFPAQEHYVTNILRQKLISAIDKLDLSNKKDSTMLFFLPEGEMHEMSLLFYSYLAQKYRYNVIYLGQFVPFNDLKNIESNIKIDYVFTAFINSTNKEILESYLVDLKEVFQKQKIFITGRQVNQFEPKLPRNFKVVKDYKEFKKFVG